jgi:hypothetical protein
MILLFVMLYSRVVVVLYVRHAHIGYLSGWLAISHLFKLVLQLSRSSRFQKSQLQKMVPMESLQWTAGVYKQGKGTLLQGSESSSVASSRSFRLPHRCLARTRFVCGGGSNPEQAG